MTTQIELLPLVTLAVAASQDGDLLVPIGFLDAAAAPIPLVGIGFALTLKSAAVAPTRLTLALAATGLPALANGGASGVLTLFVPQAQWALVQPGTYLGDIVATGDGATIVVAALTVTQTATGGCQITSVTSVARNGASAGSVGYIPGPGWNQYKGNYSATVSYVANDVVYYAFSTWIALGPTKGQAPAAGSATWNLVAPGVDPSIVAAAVALSSQVAAAQATAGAAAPNNSPGLTGTPTAPTPAANDNSSRIATTGFVQALIAILTNAAPSTLNTLTEIDTAINNDPNFATTVMTALATKAPSANANLSTPTITGGTIDGAVIGGTTPAAAKFTSLTVTTSVAFPVNSVPLAAMVQAPAGTLRGNLTTAMANVADSTLSAYMDDAFGTTRGTIIVRGAGGYVGLAPATSGTVLTYNGLDTVFAVSTPGTGALRYDAAQTITAPQGGQARYNIGKSAPIVTTGNFNVDPNLGIDQVTYFNGPHTATLPANANVFAGWTTAEFHNLVAASLGTVAPPSNATLYNGAATVASVVVAYGQRVKFLFDGSAWRTVWIERTPLLLVGSYSGVASFDFAIPAGYQTLEWIFGNIVPSVNGSVFGARLSADGGTTIRAGSSDYTLSELYNGASNTVGAGSTTASLLRFTDAINTSAYAARQGYARTTMDLKYGTSLSLNGQVSPSPYDNVEIAKAAQNEATALISPNLVRFLSSGGGTISLTVSCRGIPAQ